MKSLCGLAIKSNIDVYNNDTAFDDNPKMCSKCENTWKFVNNYHANNLTKKETLEVKNGKNSHRG